MVIAKSTTVQKRSRDGRKAMPGIRLVDIHSRSSRECEQILSELLELAKAGRLTGINWSAVTDGRGVVSGRAGVMARDDGLALLSSFRKAVDIISDARP